MVFPRSANPRVANLRGGRLQTSRETEKAAGRESGRPFEIWLPAVDTLRNLFYAPDRRRQLFRHLRLQQSSKAGARFWKKSYSSAS